MKNLALGPLGVSGAFLLVYAVTRIHVHRFDAVVYMVAAEGPTPGFSPHHLLYAWVASLVCGLAGGHRFAAGMQWLSIVCAAAALGLYCGVLRRLLRGAELWWAVLGAVLLGVSSSFWISAVETDPYAMTLLGIVAATACYLRAAAGASRAWHLVAGLAVAAATLVHQLVALYTLAYLSGLILGRGPRRLSGAVAFLTPAAGIPAVVYLSIGMTHGFFNDLTGLFRWLTEGAQGGPWRVLHGDGSVEALYGFLYALVGGAGGIVPPVATRVIVVVTLGTAGYLLVRRRAVAGRVPRAVVGLLLVWIVIYAAFIVWWAPFHTVHWQFVLVPLIAVAIWLLEGSTRGRGGRRVVLGVLTATIALVGIVNYVRVVWPLTLAENNRQGIVAERALATMPEGARIVAPISVATEIIRGRRGWESVFVVPHSPGGRDTTAEIVRALHAFVEQARREHRSVWVFANLFASPRGRLVDPAFRSEVRRALEGLAADGRLTILPTDGLDEPLRRHPWDVIDS